MKVPAVHRKLYPIHTNVFCCLPESVVSGQDQMGIQSCSVYLVQVISTLNTVSRQLRWRGNAGGRAGGITSCVLDDETDLHTVRGLLKYECSVMHQKYFTFLFTTA